MNFDIHEVELLIKEMNEAMVLLNMSSSSGIKRRVELLNFQTQFFTSLLEFLKEEKLNMSLRVSSIGLFVLGMAVTPLFTSVCYLAWCSRNFKKIKKS